MLEIVIPDAEYYDDEKEEFLIVKGETLQLEHSLVSLSKWESKYEKPFLTGDEKTEEENVYYIRCMIINDVKNPDVIYAITPYQAEQIANYISKQHTATWFAKDNKGSSSREVITSEVIYYWMITLNIPFSCETWNLWRLLTLIRVVNLKNQPQKKMSKSEAAARMRELNQQRKQRYNTKG